MTIRKILFFSVVICELTLGVLFTSHASADSCSGTPITFLNAQKKVLTLGEQFGRPGTCLTPTKIVIHTTNGGNEKKGQTMDELYNDLNSAKNTEGVSSNFLINEQGQIMQLVEMYPTMSETTRGVHGYNDDQHNEQISIELMSPASFTQGKSEVPSAQYQTTINLVQALMKQYNIPLGYKEYNWLSPTDEYNPDAGAGVFGHYQLNPHNKSDPGISVMRDLRVDLKNTPSSAQPNTTSKNVVQIGDSLTAGMFSAGGINDKYTAAGWTAIIPGANPSGDGSCAGGFVAGYPCHALAAGAAPTGLEAIDLNEASIKLAGAVVIEMGTNAIESDDVFKDGIAQAATKIHALTPNAKMYWVNLVAMSVNESGRTGARTTQYSIRNKIITDVAAANNITVLDWFHKVFPTGDPTNITDQLVDTNGYFPTKGDGIHLTGKGYQAMSEFIASSITGGASTDKTLITQSQSSVACAIVKVGTPSTPPPVCPSGIPQSATIPSGDGTHPVAPSVPDGNYIKAIQDTFGVTVGAGFNPPNEDYNPYKVIWEKLWDVSNTNFTKYLKQVNAQILPINGGSITSGNVANIRSNVEDAELFRVIFIHELGHVIRNKLPAEISKRAEATNVLATEGGLTTYSDNPSCAYSGYSSDGVRQDEDYAEMTTYYFNKGVIDRTNCTQGVIPFANGAHPQHFSLAESIFGKY